MVSEAYIAKRAPGSLGPHLLALSATATAHLVLDSDSACWLALLAVAASLVVVLLFGSPHGRFRVLAEMGGAFGLIATVGFAAAVFGQIMRNLSVACTSMLTVCYFDISRRSALVTVGKTRIALRLTRSAGWLLFWSVPISVGVCLLVVLIVKATEALGLALSEPVTEPAIYYSMIWAPWVLIYIRTKWALFKDTDTRFIDTGRAEHATPESSPRVRQRVGNINEPYGMEMMTGELRGDNAV